MKSYKTSIFAVVIAAVLSVAMCGCASSETAANSDNYANTNAEELTIPDPSGVTSQVSLDDIPEYSGQPYAEINGNVPNFTEEELASDTFESYKDLDTFGRCTQAFALVGPETLPTEKRGSISNVHPSGWHTDRYSFVDGAVLYNRCHLIAYSLTAENANECNLITGTRYMNIEGMNPFEIQIADYVKDTGNHVLYRVTPIFDGEDLVCRGVQMEGYSVEDSGAGVCFNVFCYNVQPGVDIDYATGNNCLSHHNSGHHMYDGHSHYGMKMPYAGGALSDSSSASASSQNGENGESATNGATNGATNDASGTSDSSATAHCDYILNTNTMKFHHVYCSDAGRIKDKNKSEYSGTREELLDMGYSPCKRCCP